MCICFLIQIDRILNMNQYFVFLKKTVNIETYTLAWDVYILLLNKVSDFEEINVLSLI